MIASVLILTFSVVLFVYWFRYTCLLILHTKTAHRYAIRIAAANRLCFLDVKEQLGQGTPLDPLHRALESDYRIINYLFKHAAGLGAQSLEQKVLMLDYRIMRLWYGIMRSVSEPLARAALKEMSSILAYFAGAMGQRAASIS